MQVRRWMCHIDVFTYTYICIFHIFLHTYPWKKGGRATKDGKATTYRTANAEAIEVRRETLT